MVSARVLMVALAYAVMKIAEAIVGIYIADEAFPTALRTEAFLLTMPRDAGTVKNVAIICIHDHLDFNVHCSFLCESPFVRSCPTYIGTRTNAREHVLSLRREGQSRELP